MEKDIFKVRIAPSPTGDPHVGTAYIALFNYAFAKKNKGKFILRIEDTDKQRSTLASENKIFEALRWLGLNWDEGPDIGGDNGPYRQSERLHIYQEYIKKLIDNGSAYYCFCSSERLDSIRAEQIKIKQTPRYDRFCLNLSKEEILKRLAAGEKHTIRLKVPDGVTYTVADLLRKPVEFKSEQIDDQVLMKSDGFPTYHFASVVDDHLMGITHVIRAEEWLNSTPKHIILYHAFGWKEPVWVHMPLLRNRDKSKISKRKNPTSLNFYKKIGILPEAMLNYLGLMGWSISGDRDLFSLDEFTEKLSFDRMSLGGPIFDFKKLLWVNGQYIKKLNDGQVLERLKKEILTDDLLLGIIDIYKDRASSLLGFIEEAAPFFRDTFDLSHDSFSTVGHPPKEICSVFELILGKIEECRNYSKAALDEILLPILEETKWTPSDFYSILRIAITGKQHSPDIRKLMSVLGKELTVRRLQSAIEALRAAPAKKP